MTEAACVCAGLELQAGDRRPRVGLPSGFPRSRWPCCTDCHTGRLTLLAPSKPRLSAVSFINPSAPCARGYYAGGNSQPHHHHHVPPTRRCARVVAWLESLADDALKRQGMVAFAPGEGTWHETKTEMRTRAGAGAWRHGALWRCGTSWTRGGWARQRGCGCSHGRNASRRTHR